MPDPNSIDGMLSKLARRYNVVELTFARVGYNGDYWFGVKCKHSIEKKPDISTGGHKTPGAALKEAVRIAGTLK